MCVCTHVCGCLCACTRHLICVRITGHFRRNSLHPLCEFSGSSLTCQVWQLSSLREEPLGGLWCIFCDGSHEPVGMFLELTFRPHHLLRKGLTVCLFTSAPIWPFNVWCPIEALHGCLRTRKKQWSNYSTDSPVLSSFKLMDSFVPPPPWLFYRWLHWASLVIHPSICNYTLHRCL